MADATTNETGSRRAAYVGIGALVLFWLLVVVAGSLQPRYSHGRDFVSSLASVGARHAWVGVLALVAFGVAYLAAAVVLERWVVTRLGAVLLLGAGLLTWVVAFSRIDCPGGAAYCGQGRPGVPSGDGGFGPMLHGWAVAGSYVLVLVAMLWLGYLWWVRRHPWRTAGSVAAFVGSLATVPFWLGSSTPGFSQRVWLGILTAWVVLICARPLMDSRAPEEAQQ